MYSRGNKTKIITSLVLVLVLGLSIGFAAFSNVLRITPQATITPDSADFNIDFSSSSTGVVANDITPTLTGTGFTAEAAEIDNSTNPTISNLSVNFTNPGQKAEYSFYAYNNGAYLAYLNSVNFINPEGKDAFITCTADDDTTQYVSDACSGIKVSIKVGSLETDVTKEGIQGHSLATKTAEEVIVTIEYATGSAVADGSFTVDIGYITLVYTTLDSQSTGIKIAANPTHSFYLFGETFLIDSTTTWQQLIDGSNGVISTELSPGAQWDYLALKVNNNGGYIQLIRGTGYYYGIPDLDVSCLDGPILNFFNKKTNSENGYFIVEIYVIYNYCSFDDYGSPDGECDIPFDDVYSNYPNEVGYIELIS